MTLDNILIIAIFTMGLIVISLIVYTLVIVNRYKQRHDTMKHYIHTLEYRQLALEKQGRIYWQISQVVIACNKNIIENLDKPEYVQGELIRLESVILNMQTNKWDVHLLDRLKSFMEKQPDELMDIYNGFKTLVDHHYKYDPKTKSFVTAYLDMLKKMIDEFNDIDMEAQHELKVTLDGMKTIKVDMRPAGKYPFRKKPVEEEDQPKTPNEYLDRMIKIESEISKMVDENIIDLSNVEAEKEETKNSDPTVIMVPAENKEA